MSSIPSRTENKTHIDIASIVRRVMYELNKLEAAEVVSEQPNAVRATTFVFDHRVITLSDIEGVPAAMKTIELPVGGIVTPAVRDVLRSRSIAVVHGVSKAINNQAHSAAAKSNARSLFRPVNLRHDRSIDMGLWESIKNQLSIRGIKLCDRASRSVLLTNQPASAVFRCVSENLSAVSINRIDDIARFKNEFDPSVYVLDVLHLNVVALVNAIVQISRSASQSNQTDADAPKPRITIAGGQQ